MAFPGFDGSTRRGGGFVDAVESAPPPPGDRWIRRGGASEDDPPDPEMRRGALEFWLPVRALWSPPPCGCTRRTGTEPPDPDELPEKPWVEPLCRTDPPESEDRPDDPCE